MSRKKQQIVPPGHGLEYEWSSDHIFVKTTAELADGRVSVQRIRPARMGLFTRHVHHLERKIPSAHSLLEKAGEIVRGFNLMASSMLPKYYLFCQKSNNLTPFMMNEEDQLAVDAY